MRSILNRSNTRSAFIPLERDLSLLELVIKGSLERFVA